MRAKPSHEKHAPVMTPLEEALANRDSRYVRADLLRRIEQVAAADAAFPAGYARLAQFTLGIVVEEQGSKQRFLPALSEEQVMKAGLLRILRLPREALGLGPRLEAALNESYAERPFVRIGVTPEPGFEASLQDDNEA